MWVTPPAGKRAAPTAGAVVRSKKFTVLNLYRLTHLFHC